MVTKDEVLERISRGESYEEIAEQLGIPAEQAYLVATGRPADGSDSLAPEDRLRAGMAVGERLPSRGPRPERLHSNGLVRSFLRQRVGGDLALRDAARERTAAPPEPVLPADKEVRDDLLEVLRRDHNQVRYLMEQIEALPQPGTTKEVTSRYTSILDMMTMALSPHEAAEEAELWPLVARCLPGGEELARRAGSDEQGSKERLETLADLSPEEPRFVEELAKLLDDLRRHVAFEERVFLQLEETVARAERARVGRRVERLEKLGPTRPHAKAGSSRAAALAAPLTGLLDRTKDAAKGRPATRLGRRELDVPEETAE